MSLQSTTFLSRRYTWSGVAKWPGDGWREELIDLHGEEAPVQLQPRTRQVVVTVAIRARHVDSKRSVEVLSSSHITLCGGHFHIIPTTAQAERPGVGLTCCVERAVAEVLF